MIKLNNKGFAISTIIYSTLILFLMVMLSFLQAISTSKNKLELASTSAKEIISYSNIDINFELGSEYYITPYRGKYTISTSEGTACIYLPKNTLIMQINNNLKINDEIVSINNNTSDKYKFLNIDNTNTSSNIVILKVYTNKANNN